MTTDRYGRTYDEQGRLCHGDWRISPNEYHYSANDKWYFEHKNNDGGDRYGFAPTWRAAMVEIDERGDQA